MEQAAGRLYVIFNRLTMAFFYAHIQAKLFSRLESCISRVESTINDIRLSNLPKIIEKGLEGKLHTCPEL